MLARVIAPGPFRSVRGVRLPSILYGTAWKKERTAALVQRALELGFRGVDTACQPKHYDEAGVGQALRVAVAGGLDRGELFLQTKFTPLAGQDRARVPYDAKASLPEQVRQSCQKSLENLGTTYIDSLLIHSPLSTFERTLQVWRELERLVDSGVVRQLGISNCYECGVLEALFRQARVKPLVVQNRFYVDTGYDKEIRAYCNEQGLVYQSFWTLSANPNVLAHAHVRALSKRHAATPAQVLFRGLTQLGVQPLTGTTSEEHMRESLAIFDFELDAAELDGLVGLLQVK
jgi:diketogulonate reductase-like aldo/keto reductase